MGLKFYEELSLYSTGFNGMTSIIVMQRLYSNGMLGMHPLIYAETLLERCH
jgi:hypothetical protein